MTVFDNIKKISKLRGLSLSQLNDKAGLKQNIIYSWKTNETSAVNLEKVAKVLGVTIDELLGNKPTTTKSIDLETAVNDEDFFLTYQGKELSDTDKELIKRIFEGKN